MKQYRKNKTLPSLCYQVHWQNALSQRYDKILPKSLSAHPAPTYGLKDDAAKINEIIKKDKNGQLVIE